MTSPADQAVFELDLYGFTVLPDVLTPGQTANFAAILDAADQRLGVEYVYENAYARLVPCVPALDDECLGLVDNQQVMTVLERVLGNDIVLGSMNSRIVRPGDPEQGLHSDIPSVHRRVIGTPVMLQVVWMIDGFTKENGATRVVPGSHKHPESAPLAGMDVPYIVQPTGGPGSVMIFNGQCWHGGGTNHTGQRRRAIFGHYRVGPWMRFQTDPALYLDEARWQKMTPRQRELLRMTHGQAQKNAADYYPDQPHEGRYD